MAKLRIDVVGADDVDEALFKMLYAHTVEQMEWASSSFLRRIRMRLNRRGSGRFYKSKLGDGTMHQASAPDEPPAKDTGNYRDSWQAYIIKGKDFVTLVARSPLWTVFGRRLEYGGRDSRGIYIAPRPHVRPVMDNLENDLMKRLEQ